MNGFPRGVLGQHQAVAAVTRGAASGAARDGGNVPFGAYDLSGSGAAPSQPGCPEVFRPTRRFPSSSRQPSATIQGKDICAGDWQRLGRPALICPPSSPTSSQMGMSRKDVKVPRRPGIPNNPRCICASFSSPHMRAFCTLKARMEICVSRSPREWAVVP